MFISRIEPFFIVNKIIGDSKMKQNSKMKMKIEFKDNKDWNLSNKQLIDSYERRYGKYEGYNDGMGNKYYNTTPMKLLEHNINNYKRFNSTTVENYRNCSNEDLIDKVVDKMIDCGLVFNCFCEQNYEWRKLDVWNKFNKNYVRNK